MKKGLFITFEGPEGSGKSTQSKLLFGFLKKLGFEIYHTREPGGTAIGEKIRKLLLDISNSNMAQETELLLYLAARRQLIEERIKPELKKGRIVICDRFQDATMAYQGYGLGMDKKLIRFLGALVTDAVIPDITILLDIRTEKGIKRAKRDDRIEKRSLEFHRRVRRGYLELARKEPSRIRVIPVSGGISKTQNLIRKVALNGIKRSNISGSRPKAS
jgi:dTMP kinase